MRGAIAIAIALSACADYRLAIPATIASSMTMCDFGQTIYVSDNGRWDRVDPHGNPLKELNPLLGHEPSVPHLAGIAAFDMSINLAVYETTKIPTWAKLAWFGAVIAAEAWVIQDNYPIGAVCGVAGRSHSRIEP